MTVHRPPPLDAAGFPVRESVAAARALLARGVPPARIWAETASLDTIGDAYFDRVIHADPAGLRRLLVVNSAFHMPRTRLVFDWVFGLPPADPPYALDYHAVPDRGLTAAGLAARRAKEAARVAELRRTIPRIASLAALHRWLFTEHRAYAAGGESPERRAPGRGAGLGVSWRCRVYPQCRLRAESGCRRRGTRMSAPASRADAN